MICFFKPIILCHHRQKLHGLLDMLNLFRIRHIVAILPHLHKIIRNNTEVTLKQFYLLSGQVRNFKQIDSVVIDIGIKLRRNVQPFLQAGGLIPRAPIAIVQHQRHHRVSALCLIVRQQLRPILCAVIAHDPQRHIRIGPCLVFKPYTGHADIGLLPALRHIPLQLPELTVSLVKRVGGLVFQLIG